MTGVAIRHVERVALADVESLGALGSATVSEAQGRSGLMDTAIRPIYAVAAIGGRVALEIMRTVPHRVTRLALLDTGYNRGPARKPARPRRAGVRSASMSRASRACVR